MRSDPEFLGTLRLRARILAAIRRAFDGDGFVEVTTPSLVLAPDPALHLDSFRTELSLPRGSVTFYLPTSPEHHMKRMVAAGMPRIYQVCPFFRNGEITPLHNPVFTGLEWYETGTRVEECMDRTEQLVRVVAGEVLGHTTVARNNHTWDLSRRFRRLTVREALVELASVAVPERWEEDRLRSAIERAGIPTAADDSFDDLVNRVLVERVEPALQRLGPTFLSDYPAPMASQARLRPDRPWEAERFELYIGGIELCNGYGELTDAAAMRRRFMAQREERRVLGKIVPPLDEAYLAALEQGMPACTGCALGVDRLVMVLGERMQIEDVVAFPLSVIRE